jgi:probable rRNA maturation factor
MKNGPAISVAIANRQRSMSLCGARLRQAVRAALAGTSVRKAQISLAVVNDRTIARLNRQFLSHEGPTDVLSFLLEQRPGWLEGEVVVSAETARREAPHYGWQPQDELLLYVVHGALHLAGHDDRSAAGRARMQARELAVLEELGAVCGFAGAARGRIKDKG